MNIIEKYGEKTINELGKLFFEIGNKQLVPELSKHINLALEKFKEMQDENSELNEIIIVADIDEDMSVTIYGGYYYGETEVDPFWES